MTQATLSMEGSPGLVRVMGLGAGQLQHVKVMSKVFRFSKLCTKEHSSQLSLVGLLPLLNMDLILLLAQRLERLPPTAVTVDTHFLDQTT